MSEKRYLVALPVGSLGLALTALAWMSTQAGGAPAARFDLVYEHTVAGNQDLYVAAAAGVDSPSSRTR